MGVWVTALCQQWVSFFNSLTMLNAMMPFHQDSPQKKPAELVVYIRRPEVIAVVRYLLFSIYIIIIPRAAAMDDC